VGRDWTSFTDALLNLPVPNKFCRELSVMVSQYAGNESEIAETG